MSEVPKLFIRLPGSSPNSKNSTGNSTVTSSNVPVVTSSPVLRRPVSMDTGGPGNMSIYSPHSNQPKRLTCWTGRQLLKPAVKDFSDQQFPTKRSLSSSSEEESNHTSQSLLGDRKQILTCRPIETYRQPTHRGLWVASGVADNAEEIHRRHVQRSARLRTRLGYSRSLSANQLFAARTPCTDTEIPLALQVSRPGESLNSKMEFQRRIYSARPSTTGRYFDTTNGLRSRNGGNSRRPRTAGSWLTAGLKIQSIQLHSKMPLLAKRQTLQENLLQKHLNAAVLEPQEDSTETKTEKNVIETNPSTDT